MPIVTQYSSKNVCYGLAFINTVLAAFKTLGTAPLILATAKVRLSNLPSFNPTPQMTVAGNAANECAYSGYTAGGIVAAQTPGLVLSPNAQGDGVSALFEAATASPFVGDTAYGYWIDDGTNVIAAEAFTAGTIAAFAAVGNFLQLNIFLPIQFRQATS